MYVCVQFHEQRLKGCQLKRHAFQQCFLPESQPFHPRKRFAQNDALEDLGSVSAKHSRRESGDEKPEMKVELPDQEGGNSSSSESQDELPVHFKLQEVAGRSHQAGASDSGQPTKSGLTTYIIADGEDIVSSSGMEPDTGTDLTLSLTNEPAAAASGQQTPLQTSSLSMGVEKSQDQPPSQTSSLSSKVPSLQGAPSTTVKQESDLGDEDFAHALGRKPADLKQPDTENAYYGDEALAGSAVGVELKREAGDPWAGKQASAVLGSDCAHRLSQRDKPQNVSLPRCASSPPLSQIRVENLQQQFEESFGIQSNITAPGLQLSDPHPVQLFAKSQRQLLPELVENFLLDSPLHHPQTVEFEPQQSSEVSGEGQSASSVLRHLLTRPYGQVNPSQESSLASYAGDGDRVDDPSQPVEEGDSQSCVPHRHNDHTPKMAGSALASQRHTQNFLLTSEGEGAGQDCRGQSRAFLSHMETTESDGLLQSDASAKKNPKPIIKQEPEENVEDFSQAQMNTALTESDHSNIRNSSSLPENAYHMFSDMKQSLQSLPQSSALSLIHI